MSEKLDKNVVALYADTYAKLYDRVDYVVGLLLKSGKMRGHYFEDIEEITMEKVRVRVETWDEPEIRTFPIEYLYDDTVLDEIKEAIRIAEELKKQKELEDKAYYARIEKEDEIKLLKKLQKKYPDVK